MINLLLQGQIAVFFIILIAIVISLTFHEFGHAITAKFFGDDTAQKAGRLTLNPLAHIDPAGLLMVAIIGFGYAKPVPTNPHKFNSSWAGMLVSAAGPAMNLLIAMVAINFYAWGLAADWNLVQGDGAQLFFVYLALINLVLMIFNLIPIGALDGHYILPYFLPEKTARAYRHWNNQYGNQILLGLMVLSLFGVPVFSYIRDFGQALLPLITFIKPEHFTPIL
ncbi:MAG: site-2 protease family protein [Gammaproteobacteria bacterium]